MKSFNTILAALVLCVLCQCKQGSFTARKYTKGHYRENHDKVLAAKPNKSVEKKTENPVAKKSYKDLAKGTPAAQSGLDSKPLASRNSVEKAADLKTKKTIPEKKPAFKNKPAFNPFFNKEFKSLDLKKSKSSAGKSPDNGPLIATIAGVLGIILDYMAYALVIITGEYFVLALFAIAIVFGIIGVIMGSKGLKNFNRESRKGDKNVANLVLSIVGLATGAVSLVLAVYLGIYSLVWLALSGI
jgi:hypothetical protein